MKKLVLILSALFLMVVFCSCQFFGNKEQETTGSADTTAQTGSGTAATTDTEEETTMPRLDYFGEDMDRYLSIDREDYMTIEVTVSDEFVIGDDDVEDYINSLRLKNKTADTGAVGVTDQPIALGDVVHFYYRGTIDGEAFEGGSYLPEKYDTPAELEIGSGRFIPGFEDAMIGIVPNTTSEDRMTSIKVTFPANYNKKLGGKEATFELYVVSVDKYILPTYDDSFITGTLKYEAKKKVYEDGELKAEFESEIRKQLVENIEDDLKNAKISAVWEKLYTLCTVKEIPQIEYDYYYKQYMDQFEQAYAYYNQQSVAYYGYKKYENFDVFAVEYMGLEEGDDWRTEFDKRCREAVMQNLLFHTIARKEGMEQVSDEEYRAELKYYVDMYSIYGYTEEDIEKLMGKSQLRESALYSKIADYLLGNTTVTFTKLTAS